MVCFKFRLTLTEEGCVMTCRRHFFKETLIICSSLYPVREKYLEPYNISLHSFYDKFDECQSKMTNIARKAFLLSTDSVDRTGTFLGDTDCLPESSNMCSSLVRRSFVFPIWCGKCKERAILQNETSKCAYALNRRSCVFSIRFGKYWEHARLQNVNKKWDCVLIASSPVFLSFSLSDRVQARISDELMRAFWSFR